MSEATMRVLGVDPGTAITGYGLVESVHDELGLVTYGTITTSAGQPMAERLATLYHQLSQIIRDSKPTELAVEELFFHKNVRTALAVGQARGVVLLAASHAGLPVSEYTPLQVKDAVVGYGRATKEQVQEMVRMLLGLDVVPRPDDAADAIAVAICHCHAARLTALLDAAAQLDHG